LAEPQGKFPKRSNRELIRPSRELIRLNREAPAIGQGTRREVGAFDAKNKLGQLLDLVERGEEIITTRRGQPVAPLVPAKPAFNRDEARAAIRRIRERAENLKLGPFEWTDGNVTGTKPAASLVLDSSAALAWIYAEETTDAVPRIFEIVAERRSGRTFRVFTVSPS
jgi:prevent-host-death family protein